MEKGVALVVLCRFVKAQLQLDMVLQGSRNKLSNWPHAFNFGSTISSLHLPALTASCKTPSSILSLPLQQTLRLLRPKDFGTMD